VHGAAELARLCLAAVLLGFTFGAPGPVRRLAPIWMCIPVGLRVVAQIECLTSLCQFASERAFGVFPENGGALCHGAIVPIRNSFRCRERLARPPPGDLKIDVALDTGIRRSVVNVRRHVKSRDALPLG
jgi:hypothetical protein